MQDYKVVARWRVITASAPAAEIIASNYSVLAKHIQGGTSSTVGTGTYGALVFNLKPGASVYFAAGTRGLAPVCGRKRNVVDGVIGKTIMDRSQVMCFSGLRRTRLHLGPGPSNCT
ncbi:MAG: hypothetical protein ACYCUV_06650 [Phycisphaerae bacterium]